MGASWKGGVLRESHVNQARGGKEGGRHCHAHLSAAQVRGEPGREAKAGSVARSHGHDGGVVGEAGGARGRDARGQVAARGQITQRRVSLAAALAVPTALASARLRPAITGGPPGAALCRRSVSKGLAVAITRGVAVAPAAPLPPATLDTGRRGVLFSAPAALAAAAAGGAALVAGAFAALVAALAAVLAAVLVAVLVAAARIVDRSGLRGRGRGGELGRPAIGA